MKCLSDTHASGGEYGLIGRAEINTINRFSKKNRADSCADRGVTCLQPPGQRRSHVVLRDTSKKRRLRARAEKRKRTVVMARAFLFYSNSVTKHTQNVDYYNT